MLPRGSFFGIAAMVALSLAWTSPASAQDKGAMDLLNFQMNNGNTSPSFTFSSELPFSVSSAIMQGNPYSTAHYIRLAGDGNPATIAKLALLTAQAAEQLVRDYAFIAKAAAQAALEVVSPATVQMAAPSVVQQVKTIASRVFAAPDFAVRPAR